MASLGCLRILALVCLIAIVQARILRLHSSDDFLVSDGVDGVESDESSSLGANDPPPPTSTCQHTYGFLPCSDNAAGYIFEIFIYQGLLAFGEKEIGKGGSVVSNILGSDKLGGVVLRILLALPSMMMMIISGVFSSNENARSTVALGIGISAGMTVFSLTLQWAIVLIYGRRNLSDKPSTENSEDSTSSCLIQKEKLRILMKDSGATIDNQTRYTAGIMLLSLIPYIVVLFVSLFTSKFGNRMVVLTALIVSVTSLVAYFGYQIWDPWMQQRSLAYSKFELLRDGFLQHIQRLEKLVNEHGELNTGVIRRLFSQADKDQNKALTREEMEKLVREILQDERVKVDENFAVSEFMKVFDSDKNENISEDEFVSVCKNWIEKRKSKLQNGASTATDLLPQKESNSTDIDRIMANVLLHAENDLLKEESLITDDGAPNIDRIKNLFKQFDKDEDRSISRAELEQLLHNAQFGKIQLSREDVLKELFKELDTDNNNTIDETEFIEGLQKWVNKAINSANCSDMKMVISEYKKIVEKQVVYGPSVAWACTKSAIHLLLGITILTFLGGPLMNSILNLSFAMNVPSFAISFVIVPLAMNARAAIKAIAPASHKDENTASLTFSEIYGGVIMNNISGLLALLAIVYAKGLTWDYSAEVLTLLVVTAIMGALATIRAKYPLWTCILAFFLYPFSLGLFYLVQFVWKWN